MKLVKEAYLKYKNSAVMLEKEIDRDYGKEKHISHNRINQILKEMGLVHQARKKFKRKGWVRYERRHSLQAVHIDWLHDPVLKKWILPVIDDASRMLLALKESDNATTDASIEAMEEALKYGKIKQCITDRGTQFTKKEGSESRFSKFLKENDIKHILCRVNHPQTNGKVEIFNKLYRSKRYDFDSKEKFVKWYNEIRPHWSLKVDDLETPLVAFERKKRKMKQK